MALLLVGYARLAGAEESRDASPAPSISSERAGEGYTIGSTGLWIGGYLNLVGEVPESGPAAASFDDLGLLVRYEPTARLAFFGEAEVEDVVIAEEGRELRTGNDIFSLQRLFAEYALWPGVTARVGKFLTPFGLWNPARRAPLTWTVERPVVTEEAFPVSVTGPALVLQNTVGGWTLDGVVYGQAQNELVRRSDDKSASAMAGGRWSAGHAVKSGFVTTGVNLAGYKDRDTDDWETAAGIDLDIEVLPHEITIEADYLERNGSDGWGLYLQDVFPLVGSLYGVLRYEHFDFAPDHGRDGWLLGLAWRPRPNLVLKFDYQFTDKENDALPRGFLAAVAVGF